MNTTTAAITFQTATLLPPPTMQPLLPPAHATQFMKNGNLFIFVCTIRQYLNTTKFIHWLSALNSSTIQFNFIIYSVKHNRNTTSLTYLCNRKMALSYLHNHNMALSYLRNRNMALISPSP